LPRDDVDFRRGLALARRLDERLRDFVVRRVAFLLFAVAARTTFFTRLGAGLSTRAAAFLTAGFSRPSLAAFPASAPTIPPTTAPAGPIILPSAAPATAPAVSLGMGGTSMFSVLSLCCASSASAINGNLLSLAFRLSN